MMSKLVFKIIAYLDDFSACCHTQTEAMESFNAFKNLAEKLGLKLATRKCCPPSTAMEWLGYMVDSKNLKISIPDDKLDLVLKDCEVWIQKKKSNTKMVQSIAGRLIYVANCIPPARKFTARVLAALRGMNQDAWITISDEFKADLRWFVEFAKLSNGIFLFNPIWPTIEIECDFSLFGGGGLAFLICYAWTYSKQHMDNFRNIHHLEAINIIVAYQTLARVFDLHPAKTIIWTDNSASSYALLSGKTRDDILAACSRQLWLLASLNCHEIEIPHKNGFDIPIADALNRMSRDSNKAALVDAAVAKFDLSFVQPVLNNYVFFDIFL